MPLRLKWYRALPLSKAKVECLLKGFVKDEYIDGRRWGFSNVVLKGTSIDADFVERLAVVTKVKDPFGNVLEYPIVQFNQFSFTIGTKFPQLELQNGSQSIGAFINQLAAYLEFKIALEPISADLLKWIRAIEQRSESVLVSGALVSNLELSNAVHARIALLGTAEVRPFIKHLTGLRPYTFSRVQIIGTCRSQRFKCELFADGRATIVTGVESEITKMLRSTLKEAADTK